jgi:hypothetical protein
VILVVGCCWYENTHVNSTANEFLFSRGYYAAEPRKLIKITTVIQLFTTSTSPLLFSRFTERKRQKSICALGTLDELLDRSSMYIYRPLSFFWVAWLYIYHIKVPIPVICFLLNGRNELKIFVSIL